MSDLIRREDVLNVTNSHWFRDMPQVSRRFLETFWVAVNKVPAVDAVEVVRCRDCVNNPRISTKTKGMVWCRKFRNEVRPDDFCSYGERREDNAVD